MNLPALVFLILWNIFFICSVGFASTIPTDGLLSYYSFSGNANDTIGSNDGIVQGASLVTDRYGNSNSAYSFDGNDYVEVTNPQNLNSSDFTISAWVKLSAFDFSTQIIMGYGEDLSTDHTRFYLLYNNYEKAVHKYNFGTEDVADKNHNVYSNFNDSSEWQLVTGRRDSSGQMDIFVNGVLENSIFGTPPPAAINQSLYFGAMMAGESGSLYGFFNGAIDDISIYDRALTEGEIQGMYETMRPVPEPGTIFLFGLGIIGIAGINRIQQI